MLSSFFAMSVAHNHAACPQSLEIRDQNGKPVGQGSHERPEEVTEYCVFQRDMWRPLVEEDWTLVKRGAKETDLIANPEDQV